MTLDEAIQYYEEKAIELYGSAYNMRDFSEEQNDCYKRAKEYDQIAEWLKELKKLKQEVNGNEEKRKASN